MPLTLLEKELVAVAASVAAGCRPCTTYHVTEAKRAGAHADAVAKAIASAVCVRNSATEAMRHHGLGLEPSETGCGCCETDLLSELVSLGASLAANCTANIEKHLALARGLGVTREQLDEVLALATMIRSKAVHHAEKQFGVPAAQPSSGCGPEAAPVGCC